MITGTTTAEAVSGVLANAKPTRQAQIPRARPDRAVVGAQPARDPRRKDPRRVREGISCSNGQGCGSNEVARQGSFVANGRIIWPFTNAPYTSDKSSPNQCSEWFFLNNFLKSVGAIRGPSHPILT